MKRPKTGGRELATVLLLFLCYLAWEGESEAELQHLALPFVTFAIYAFGSKFVKNNPDKIATVFGNGITPENKYDEQDLREK